MDLPKIELVYYSSTSVAMFTYSMTQLRVVGNDFNYDVMYNLAISLIKGKIGLFLSYVFTGSWWVVLIAVVR